MLWALLAAFLRRRSPGAQAAVFGSCTGLFITAQTDAPSVESATLLAVTIAVVCGAAFYVALATRARTLAANSPIAVWAHGAFAAIWLLILAAAVRALVDHGPEVAVISIVPIVLLAPPALAGLRASVQGMTGALWSVEVRRSVDGERVLDPHPFVRLDG